MLKGKRFDTINVVPFIDIMLVLLTIVLTTATFIATGKIKVSLPKAEAAQVSEPKQERVITIKKQGTLFWGDEKISLETLKKRLDGQNPKDLIVLKTDKNAKFEHFVAVIDLLKMRKLHNIAIATETVK